jgi:hypothetical protein
MENLCRGMLGSRFTYLIVASGIGSLTVSLAHDRILGELEQTYQFINRSLSGGSMGNVSVQQKDYISEDYLNGLTLLESEIDDGLSCGMWHINAYYAADTQQDARRLAGLIKSVFSGDSSKPDTVRTMEYIGISSLIKNASMLFEPSEDVYAHPLGRWQAPGWKSELSMFNCKFQTVLNSKQLAVLCKLPTKEFPGFFIDKYVEFDLAERQSKVMVQPFTIGDICIAGRSAKRAGENSYSIEKDDLTRHALIVGVTGGGKTNTLKSMLSSLWCTETTLNRTPFLVIESAKREYWELRNLKGFEDLTVFTLGAESADGSVRYRLNPFEVQIGVSLQTHIDYLLSTFNAAFEMYPPMPFVLETAVYAIYSDRGWNIFDNKNDYGFTEYPTLSDLYNKIDVVVDSLGYYKELQSNLKASLHARIHSLMIGGKGAMLDTRRSIPIGSLLSKPVIMELEDIGDDNTKSFVIGMLLVQLYEYRKSIQEGTKTKLSHVLVVEEAHRLLRKVTETGDGANTRIKSVEFFCNMLAEIRTYGQGIIVSDQIPTKLAPDLLKNTNLKIVHRTVAFEDRDAIGKTMNMDEQQIDSLSCLERGYAAIYSEGDNRSKYVKVPLVHSSHSFSRKDVIFESYQKAERYIAASPQPSHHVACTFCETPSCQFEKVRSCAKASIKRPGLILDKWKARGYKPAELDAALTNEKIMAGLDVENKQVRYCMLGYLLSKLSGVSDGWRQETVAEYLKYLYK